MRSTNLRSIDLNLLVVLHALLRERSVTRAAREVGMTQPAASHALERLRHLFGDPLLERRGIMMQPTPKAEHLLQALTPLMDDIRNLVQMRDIPLEEIEQTVTVAMPDYASALILPAVWAALQRIAPRVAISCVNWTDPKQEVERLRKGEVHVALSSVDTVPEDVARLHVGSETYTGLARQGHPAGRAPSLRTYLGYRHVVVSARGAQSTRVDDTIRATGERRDVAVSVASFLAVREIVAASDILALVPTGLARRWASEDGLRAFKAPMDISGFSVDVLHHQRHRHDPAIQAVTGELVRAVAAAIAAPERAASGKARPAKPAGQRSR
jgi:DNA-binding transcriptional LysR family regulator